MKSETRNEVKRISRLAWAARNLPIGESFTKLPSIKAFIRLVDYHGYIFAELCAPFDGCTVCNEADQIFQFCCSIEQNEADTEQGI